MRKIIILFSLALLFQLNIFAQSSFGIKGNAGLLFSSVTFTDDKGSQDFFKNVSRIGITISGNKKIIPLSFCDVHAGVGLDFYNWKAVDNASELDVATYNALYLDLSTILQRSINERFTVGAGLAMGLGFTGTQTIVASGNDYAIFREEALRRTNLNLIINSTFQFNELFGFFAEYRVGLLNIEGKWDQGNQKTTLGSFRIGINKDF